MSHDPAFRPSGADTWMECGASVVIDVPRRPSGPWGDRGKFLHTLGEKALRAGAQVVKAGDLKDDEVDSVNAYVDYVSSRVGQKVYEIRTSFIPGQEGYIDALVFNGTELEVIDYKSGYTLVSPIENIQLIIYALGVVQTYRSVYDFERITLTIVQPSRENLSSWTLSVADLHQWGVKILTQVDEIKNGVAEFHPSETACKWCDAKPVCPALEMKGKEAALVAFADPADAPEIATKAELTFSDKMRLADLAETWVKAIRSEARRLLLQEGQPVEGFKVVAGRSSRSWSDRKKAKGLLETYGFGEGEIYVGDPTFVSPAQAEKLVKASRSHTKGQKDTAKERKAELAGCIEKTAGAATIAPEDDPRPAITSKDEIMRQFTEAIESDEN